MAFLRLFVLFKGLWLYFNSQKSIQELVFDVSGKNTASHWDLGFPLLCTKLLLSNGIPQISTFNLLLMLKKSMSEGGRGENNSTPLFIGEDLVCSV